MNKRASMLTKGMIATAIIFGFCIPIGILASPMFTNAQLAKIIQTENNATVKLNSPSKLEITQTIGNDSNLKIYLVNVEGAIALRATFSGNLLTGDDVNEWNTNQTIYACLKDGNVHLQSNIFTGSIDEIGTMLPDKFIRLNYDVFVQISEVFASYINEKSLAYSQNNKSNTNSANQNPSSFGRYVDDTGKAFNELAKIGDVTELQKRANSGDYTAVDEAMKGFQAFEKGLQDASKKFRDSNGISDAQAQDSIREGHCRDACMKVRAGCAANCRTGGAGASCRNACSNYYDACRIRCK